MKTLDDILREFERKFIVKCDFEEDGEAMVSYPKKMRAFIRSTYAAGVAAGCSKKHKEDPMCQCWLDGYNTAEAEALALHRETDMKAVKKGFRAVSEYNRKEEKK